MPRSATDIQTELDLAYAARAALYGGQSVTSDGTSLTRVRLDEINATIAALESELAATNRKRFTRTRISGW